MEKFYSCYRDGLDGGKDLRSFVCLPFLLRLSLLVGVLTQTFVTFWFFHFLLFGGASLLIAIVLNQPYKQTYENAIESLILAIISLIGSLYILYLNLGPDQEQHSTFFLTVLCLDFTLPLLGIVVVILFKIFKSKLPSSWIHAISQNFCRSSKTDTSNSDEENNEAQIGPVVAVSTTTVELPDRILHPYRYVGEWSHDTETQ